MSTNDTEPRRVPHHTLVQLEVSGGFLGGLQLNFADGLNCFIGGRGAGKTTALEFLRFALGLMPDPKLGAQRHRAVDALIKANLGAGRLNVELRTKTDMRYTAGRSANEAVQVVNEHGVAVPIALDRDLIFSADVFSQNEIEDIASSPAAQLALIDRFEEPETSAVENDLAQLRRQVEQAGADLHHIDCEIEDLRSKASELQVIEEKLKGLAEVGGPDAAKINSAHSAMALRKREERLPEAVVGIMQKVVRETSGSVAALQAALEGQLDASIRRGPNQDLFEVFWGDLQDFVASVQASASAIASSARDVEEKVRVHAGVLSGRHAVQEAEYRAIVSESQEQGGRFAERSALQTAQVTALAAYREQDAKQKQRSEMQMRRQQLLARMSELRDRRYALRKRVAARLTSQFAAIRVTVLQGAEAEGYRDFVAEKLKGIGIKHVAAADKIVQSLAPTELGRLVLEGDHAGLMDRVGLEEERARKIVNALRLNGTAYELEAIDVEDRPCIELRDGAVYKQSSNLSTGQRCTTILPILLVQSERPLLIDQPEDNLDNAFVYDTIVKALREIKGSRQVIFVTHNPNIPVLGEAERVFVFTSDGQQATLRRVGTVDECKEDIERILEGGREAFLLRKDRYGH